MEVTKWSTKSVNYKRLKRFLTNFVRIIKKGAVSVPFFIVHVNTAPIFLLGLILFIVPLYRVQ